MKIEEVERSKRNKTGGLPGGFPSGLAAPARRAISQAGFTNLEQLTEISEAEFKQLHGIGPKALDLLRQALHEKGLTFTQERPAKKD